MTATRRCRRSTTETAARLVVGLTACATLAGCGSGPRPTASNATSAAATSPVSVAPRPGWTSAGVDGKPPTVCHARPAPDGTTLPDTACTPGATDRSVPAVVSPHDLPALAARDRTPPPTTLSAARSVVFAAYGIPEAQRSDYTLDTLIPVSLGGSWDYRNLWPLPTPARFAPNRTFRSQKDVVTVYLHDAVARRLVPLAAAQSAIGEDWVNAVAALGLPSVPRSFAQGG